ncbi:hypothetical protein M2347_002320 [Chryseobacterium sp. H1D6B]|nr:hypothetical protein [Chryseobacterium sp. H1D6B]
MILIDYLYYQFTNFYKYFEKDGTHKVSGYILTCVMLNLNLIIVTGYSDYFFNTNITENLSKYQFFIYFCVPLNLLVAVRYWKFISYDEIKNKVKAYNKTSKIIADILLILYVIFSLPVGIYLAVKLHSLNQII